MEAPHGTIRFDGDEVCTVAARLSESAEDSDAEIRRAFGGLDFDGSGAGSAHESTGATVEAGYRRLRAACEAWVAATQAHADALQVAADRYRRQDHETAAALSAEAALSDPDDRRSGQL
ncbi:type VII secretion target [Rhodococcus sp. NPDC047139]|uniref:type VII secretion target n=1 Tax=Rhodococcus sp. NPDC047139 TaxID=3155141 RepID=UPI0033D84CA7